MAHAREGVVERALTAVGTLSLLALMLIVTIDVAGRNLFNSPLLWGTEVMEVLLGLMVFAFYPVIARRHRHIVVDLVPVPRAIQGLQRVLAGAVGAALFGLIAWTCGRQALRSADYGDASGILGIPTAWVMWGMSALACLSALIFLAQALGVWRRETELAGQGD